MNPITESQASGLHLTLKATAEVVKEGVCREGVEWIVGAIPESIWCQKFLCLPVLLHIPFFTFQRLQWDFAVIHIFICPHTAGDCFVNCFIRTYLNSFPPALNKDSLKVFQQPPLSFYLLPNPQTMCHVSSFVMASLPFRTKLCFSYLLLPKKLLQNLVI